MQEGARLQQATANRLSVEIIYDGDCPFCASFVKMVRLRDVFGQVNLIDARDSTLPLVDSLRQKYRLDDGFVVIHDNQEFYGHEALNFISLATSDSSLVRFFMKSPFFRGGLGRAIYPVMVSGRKLALRLMGRKMMNY
jgi:predicted DCC family thiol-disulfide oxidoreductase YuxK